MVFAYTYKEISSNINIMIRFLNIFKPFQGASAAVRTKTLILLLLIYSLLLLACIKSGACATCRSLIYGVVYGYIS